MSLLIDSRLKNELANLSLELPRPIVITEGRHNSVAESADHLKVARGMGCSLLVGVWTDEKANCALSEERSLRPVTERIRDLNGLDVVDFAFELNAVSTILKPDLFGDCLEAIRPDIYCVTEPGAKILHGYGPFELKYGHLVAIKTAIEI